MFCFLGCSFGNPLPNPSNQDDVNISVGDLINDVAEDDVIGFTVFARFGGAVFTIANHFLDLVVDNVPCRARAARTRDSLLDHFIQQFLINVVGWVVMVLFPVVLSVPSRLGYPFSVDVVLGLETHC